MDQEEASVRANSKNPYYRLHADNSFTLNVPLLGQQDQSAQIEVLNNLQQKVALMESKSSKLIDMISELGNNLEHEKTKNQKLLSANKFLKLKVESQSQVEKEGKFQPEAQAAGFMNNQKNFRLQQKNS